MSVTTDGFITNIVDLEEKISNGFLLQNYQSIRKDLSGDCAGLELKSSGVGVIA